MIDPAERQPVHVVYGGAHRFKAGTRESLARIFPGYKPLSTPGIIRA